ncbi:glycoside hydrolase family 5 protein [Polymorphum gilvum]|uniref:Cellulase (Glycosyl hydrolase family 5) n=1 Tax=Polymorphum gilvum (strain LMG 25793 / CGMCC 1.9160 / SL003B-26A1) TaxID=991905 RepID=F2J5G6_POLGS|nr:glycoside hydrolase family 5 protein [Polymorphum gilvum]ADZ72336.1 Cellulase (Glycosyl hydrolase family 5) [Polymorphum gilvum SL003B-26A1]
MPRADRRPAPRAMALALALVPALALGSAGAAPARECLRGANAAGGEFGPLPGRHGQTHLYPSEATLAYLAGKGMNVVRLPFRWERLQPTPFGRLDDTELTLLRASVDTAAALGLTVILDPHNYARYGEAMIGSQAVPVEAFADFWRRLAPLYAGRDDIVYLLMNEPQSITARAWLPAVNAAIAAIRAAGADNLILVPGTIWTGASHWFEDQDGGSNAEVLMGVEDPLDHYAFDVHQYMDRDFSGTNADCPRVADALAALDRVTGWLARTGNRAFLGEFGGTSSPDCLAGIAAMAAFVNARPDTWFGWAYWAAGDWWGDYPLSIQPEADGTERPQMAALEPLVARLTAAERACPALEATAGWQLRGPKEGDNARP